MNSPEIQVWQWKRPRVRPSIVGPSTFLSTLFVVVRVYKKKSHFKNQLKLQNNKFLLLDMIVSSDVCKFGMKRNKFFFKGSLLYPSAALQEPNRRENKNSSEQQASSSSYRFQCATHVLSAAAASAVTACEQPRNNSRAARFAGFSSQLAIFPIINATSESVNLDAFQSCRLLAFLFDTPTFPIWHSFLYLQ